MNLRHLDCIICIAEYRVRWSPFCDIFSRAWMGVQHGTFRPTLRLFQWPFNVFLFRTCGLVKAYRVANRCPLSMRCRVYLFFGRRQLMSWWSVYRTCCRHDRQGIRKVQARKSKADMNDLWNVPTLSSGCFSDSTGVTGVAAHMWCVQSRNARQGIILSFCDGCWF